MTSFVKKTAQKRCCSSCNINLTLWAYFPPITLLLILQWHTRVCEEMFDVNSKIAQTMYLVFEKISLSES